MESRPDTNIEDLRSDQISGLETPQVTTGLLPDSHHTAGHYHISMTLADLFLSLK